MKILRNIFLAVFAAVVLGIFGNACRQYWFEQPYRVKADCRGKGIGPDMLKSWEEGKEGVSAGVIRTAGWRRGSRQTVTSVSTVRSQTTDVLMVYGPMELAEPATVLWGSYGLAAGEQYCVLSEGLARNLFGTTDTGEEWIKQGRERFWVAGVVKMEENLLMIPMEEGDAEEIAAEWKGRYGAREGMKRLLGE